MPKRSRGTGLDLGFPTLVPRRSHRLMIKARVLQSRLLQPYPMDDSGIAEDRIGKFNNDYMYMDDVEWLERMRKKRMNALKDFRSRYRYGPGKDKKTCVWSSNTCSWLDKTSGMAWVAVHGKDTICVVTKADDKVDRKRAFDFKHCLLDIEVLQNFRESIAFEVEDLVYPSSGSCRLPDLDQIVRPFGVVSALPGTDKDDGENAVSFLERMMRRSGMDFSLNQTIRTAIEAFQFLLRRSALEEQEIQVCVWKGKYQYYTGELNRSKIKEHLSAIYGGGSPVKSKLEQPSLPSPMDYSAIDKDNGMIYVLGEEYYVEFFERNQKKRMNVVKDFRSRYRYGPEKDKKTCVSKSTCSWLDKTSGMMWVAVHGDDTICVVTKADDKVDRKRAFDFKHTLDIKVLQKFRESIAFEVEDLVYPSSESRRLSDLDQIVRPFGVVSVLPGTDKEDEENAISFLERMMRRRGIDFSFNQTIRTAIEAFQFLLRRPKLEVKEIQVCVWKGHCPSDTMELRRSEIKEHLSAIYGGGKNPSITRGP